MRFDATDHPRAATGRFTNKRQSTAEIALPAPHSAVDQLSEQILDRCPEAVSWSVEAAAGACTAPITVTFRSGSIIAFHPEGDDERHLIELLDNLSFETQTPDGTVTVDVRKLGAERQAIAPTALDDWEQQLITKIRAQYPRVVNLSIIPKRTRDGFVWDPTAIGHSWGGRDVKVNIGAHPELLEAAVRERPPGEWDVAHLVIRPRPAKRPHT